MKTVLIRLWNGLVLLCMLTITWMLLQVIGLTSFHIPTDSMQPTLQPGGCILVNKGIMGGRIFDILGDCMSISYLYIINIEEMIFDLTKMKGNSVRYRT